MQERTDLFSSYSQFKLQTTKVIEEKTAALAFFKQKMKDVNEEHLQNKAAMQQSLATNQKLTQEN